MDLKFSEMSVDTSLAREYLNKNKTLLELCNDYDGNIKNFRLYVYDGKEFNKIGSSNVQLSDSDERSPNEQSVGDTILNFMSILKQNATLIAQLEYLFRKIPVEVTNAQVNLLIQYFRCYMDSYIRSGRSNFYPDDSLLRIGSQMQWLCKTRMLNCVSKATAAISYLLVTLLSEAKGGKKFNLYFDPPRDSPKVDSLLLTNSPIRGLDSGTVVVVSDDADVDSAVDKLISVSTKAPWHLRRILVQESVYQQFKYTLNWKCNLKKSANKSLTTDALCSETLTYDDKTFLLDPVELVEENPSVATVEAYRTTKELISLLQQDKTRYLSLWTNGIAEINEVTHSTKSPVVWVNNIADFRGPAQVSEAVFAYSYLYTFLPVVNSGFAKLCTLSQSWLKLNLESRREILCGVLDKYILLNPARKELTEAKNALLTCTLKSFVDVGKDYVCIGMSQPMGVLGITKEIVFSIECLKSVLQGNALCVLSKADEEDYTLFQQAGVPVDRGQDSLNDDSEVIDWESGLDTVTRVIWTNSGTIFAN
ncbi:hypothetical protein PYW08_005900 [Mythimna loreyi]|uniref:Uncharacterized protein n=1 Tax=Mythimna loreyi TaxID=667449 RepID=A0ACC2QJY4_9NEOP|nr:hypothetical protein PYW08_005900 [Mythimna loreyi]